MSTCKYCLYEVVSDGHVLRSKGLGTARCLSNLNPPYNHQLREDRKEISPMFDNKINAIKALREMSVIGDAVRKVTVTERQNPDSLAREVTISVPYVHNTSIGLKEAKDFVEACMALGVSKYLEEQNKLDRKDHTFECSTCLLKFYSPREAAMHLSTFPRHTIKPY